MALQNLPTKILKENVIYSTNYVTDHPTEDILVICSTNYHKDIASLFQDKLFHAFNPNDPRGIHEVILLDLTSAQNRARFFDVDGELSECLEAVVRESQADFF